MDSTGGRPFSQMAPHTRGHPGAFACDELVRKSAAPELVPRSRVFHQLRIDIRRQSALKIAPAFLPLGKTSGAARVRPSRN